MRMRAGFGDGLAVGDEGSEGGELGRACGWGRPMCFLPGSIRRRPRQDLRLRPDLRHQAHAQLYELLRSPGMPDNQLVVFLTDGGEDIRDLPCYLNPQAEHYLDWFDITMRLTVLGQMTRSLPPPARQSA